MTANKIQPKEDLERFAEQWEHIRPELDPHVFVAIGGLLRLAQLLDGEFRGYTQSVHQMGMGDMRVLFALRRAGDDVALRPADLFRSLVITSGAVTKQIDRLVKRGLVERVPDPNRKGGWEIRLTAQGKKVADDAQTAIYHSFKMSKAFHRLSAAEQGAGNLFLFKLISGYEDGLDEDPIV